MSVVANGSYFVEPTNNFKKKYKTMEYEYGQGERYENETYTKIQTTLDKYKQYL